MQSGKHWDGRYEKAPPDQVSWYAPHLDRSLAMIRDVADPSDSIIDVGAGASTLVDDLVALGYSKISVLDCSSRALEISMKRLAGQAVGITWMTADVTQAVLPADEYDVWHDRAAFHFLTEPADRAAYARVASRSVKQGGHLIVAAFSREGPSRCAGLDVVRYDGDALGRELGPGWQLEQELQESHITPARIEQSWVYCLFQKVPHVGHP
ncbi:MAG: class I SAM-dependent methyltransferase [Acidobacteriota bacterium]|nr:MAG: class I SAM-dependent methyltransferase [Acidobacteriota bacterium]